MKIFTWMVVGVSAVSSCGRLQSASLTFREVPYSGTSSLSAVTIGMNDGVVVGLGGTIVRLLPRADDSDSGTNIATKTNSLPFPGISLYSVSYDGGSNYVAGGNQSRLFRSTFPTWTEVPNAFGSQQVKSNIVGVAFNGSRFVAAAQNSQVRIQPGADLGASVGWTAAPVTNALAERFRAITHVSGSTLALAGDSAMLSVSTNGGANWFDRRLNLNASTNFTGIAAGGGRIVAVGVNGVIFTSTNYTGKGEANWPKAVSPVTNTLRAVTYAGDRFIAVGDGGVMVQSTDGLNWTVEHSGTTNRLNGVAYASEGVFSGLLFAVGTNGTILVGGAKPGVPELAVSNASVCEETGAGAGEFSAVDTNLVGNTTIAWYSAPSGGEAITNGPTFAPTNRVPGNHSFWVAVRDSRVKGIVSDRVPVTFTVNPKPILAFQSVSALCVNAASVNLETNVVNALSGVGSISGLGVNGNSFSPAVAGVGTHTLTYTFISDSGCVSIKLIQVVVNPVADISILQVAPLCVDAAAVNLSASVTNVTGSGYFTGRGVSTNAGVYRFSPSVAGVGTYTLTYTFISDAGCSSSKSIQVLVNPVADISIPVVGPLCVDDAEVNLSASVTNVTGNGVFTGRGVSTNAGTYRFSPSVAGVGTNTLTYTFISDAGCDSSKTIQVVVNPIADISIQVVSPVCVDAAAVNLSASVVNGVTGSGYFTGRGVSTNAGVYRFSPSIAGVGTYTLTYTFNSDVGCSSSNSIQVVVNPLPVVGLKNDAKTNYFVSDTNVIVLSTLFTNTPADRFFFSGGGVTAGTFIPSSVTVPTNVISYRYTNSSGCNASGEIRMVVTDYPELKVQNLTNTHFELTWMTKFARYDLEKSETMTNSSWNMVTNGILGGVSSSGVQTFGTNGEYYFFRLKKLGTN